MQLRDLGGLNGWLREIRDVYRMHRDELDAIDDDDARHRRLVELNVREQCVNVAKTAFVQTRYLREQAPAVHGWVLDLSTDLLHDLAIDFPRILDEVREVYGLSVES